MHRVAQPRGTCLLTTWVHTQNTWARTPNTQPHAVPTNIHPCVRCSLRSGKHPPPAPPPQQSGEGQHSAVTPALCLCPPLSGQCLPRCFWEVLTVTPVSRSSPGLTLYSSCLYNLQEHSQAAYCLARHPGPPQRWSLLEAVGLGPGLHAPPLAQL